MTGSQENSLSVRHKGCVPALESASKALAITSEKLLNTWVNPSHSLKQVNLTVPLTVFPLTLDSDNLRNCG